jgi:hypothetical protein
MQQGVVKTIMLGIRQQRSVRQGLRKQTTLGVTRVIRQERAHLPIVFFIED